MNSLGGGAPKFQTVMIYAPESYSEPGFQQENNRQQFPPVSLVPLIDQDGAELVCSSKPVFEFVLGGDTDRLVKLTGKPECQPDPGGAAGIESYGFFFLLPLLPPLAHRLPLATV